MCSVDPSFKNLFLKRPDYLRTARPTPICLLLRLPGLVCMLTVPGLNLGTSQLS